MRKLNGAVIGLGYWGPNLVRNFLKVPGAAIPIVCDSSENSIKKFKKSFPTIKTTSNFQEILNDQSIDFISIATPLSSHYELAKQALKANKHVLIEKPMTQTSAEAEELIALAKYKNKVLMVGHTFIYTEAIKKIKQIITKKTFGKLLYFDSTRINLGRLQADTNVIWDLAPHDLSILSYLLDETPVTVEAMGSKHISRKLEIAHIFLVYKNNVTAHIHVSWLSPVKIRSMLVAGAKQMIQYNDIEPSEKIRIYNKSISVSQEEITPFAPAYRSGSVIIPKIEQVEGLYTQLNHFVECIKRKKIPLSDGIEGKKVVKLLELIEESISTKTSVFTNEK